ncbi:PREDICTED: transcription elongation factor A protein 2 [Condylura cristata]|uniref:transcription elongation factor A protein 2 n=1 Tax=Condylura cristata TaxID=143302 RepID=UPI000642D8B1|nr:PREDICTED: transcription elongation factor A protein 2 [Condylura cristata]
MPVTLALLQSTRVGVSVNALRKQSSDEEVIALAKSLIKSWKKLLDASDAKARDQRGAPPPTCSSKEAPATKAPRYFQRSPRAAAWPGPRAGGGADPAASGTLSATRIFRDVGATDMKYKNRVRSRIANLRDAKNPALRRNVLRGVITPQEIAVMTSEEMASDELKEIRKALTREAIREHQMARAGGAHSDLLACGRCRQKDCTCTQVQTRSSDEPATTLVVCTECGDRWKFC